MDIEINRVGKKYFVEIHGQQYVGRVETLGAQDTKSKFFILRGIGHVGLDISYFSAEPRMNICTPEYTRAHKILNTIRQKIRRLEGIK